MAAKFDQIGRYELITTAGAEEGTSWLILHHGRDGQEWLPGRFATRDAALLAVGIAVGSESNSTLRELCEHVLQDLNRWVTIEDITDYMARRAATG
ncbi:hypothetical protein [Kitasatospora cheerisanensis]|uniref:Uncharacterized protein n=1 Tax=Kitasatospora cheerisanensis KCTC 2395 TaxID=1348663 RepID=A0A066YVQ3_9ACTN|nr:hypothetical protein [Kitasatospora cheerisanensis]KDN85618.1 hypothetical protein KCH_26350 [Kitasatospora cheerisanensis KCTC 2395]